MDGKEAPPSYDEAISGPTGPPPASNNTGYAAPNQSATQWAYPPTSGYPQGYGNAGYGHQPGYLPTQPGYPAGYHPSGLGVPQGAYSQAPGYVPHQQGYTPGQYASQHTVVVNQTMDRGTGAVNSVPDSMGLAIFTTLCCCWPLGLVAIVKAQESRRALQTGNIQAARKASDDSRRYSKFAIIGGICWVVFCVIMLIIYISQIAR